MIVVASWYHLNTEIYDEETGGWTTLERYPYSGSEYFFLFLSNSRFATLEKTRINFQVMLQFIIMEHFSFLEVHLASAKVQT